MPVQHLGGRCAQRVAEYSVKQRAGEHSYCELSVGRSNRLVDIGVHVGELADVRSGSLRGGVFEVGGKLDQLRSDYSNWRSEDLENSCRPP